jgi:hypothetical protein
MRFILFGFLLAFFCFSKAAAQGDSLSHQNKSVLNPVDPKTVNPFLPDSVVRANHQKFLADSAALSYLIPDSARMKSGGLDSILKLTANASFLSQQGQIKIAASGKTGRLRLQRERWVIILVIGLFFYAGLLNLFFSGDLKNVVQSFYNKRSLSQTDKEAGLINSWAFAGLLVLFCLALGLILYLLTGYYKKAYVVSGFDLFVAFAGVIGALVALKFIFLKLIGFIFDISGIVSEYVAVLNLTYFSLAFVYLAAALCFSLLADQFIPQLLAVLVGLTAIVLLWQ